MPYSSTEDLPQEVRDALPARAQKQFLAAFMSAWNGAPKMKQANREQKAFRIAWAALKNAGWVKDKGTGKWSLPKPPSTSEALPQAGFMVLADSDQPMEQEAEDDPPSVSFAVNKARRGEDDGPEVPSFYEEEAALRDTLRAILSLEDPGLDRKALVQAALQDFAAAVYGMLTTPTVTVEALREPEPLQAPATTQEAYTPAEDTAGEPGPATGPGEAILCEVAEERPFATGKPGKPLTATLIKAGPNKAGTRTYTPEFLQRCVAEGRFTGSFGYLNHPTVSEAQDRPERDLARVAMRTGAAYYDATAAAVKAPIVWLAENVPGSMGNLGRDLFRDPVVCERAGLSIYWTGRVEFQEVQRPDKPAKSVMIPTALLGDGKFDVDLVTSPGAGGALPVMESDRPAETAPTAGGDKPMTLEELKAEHPELVEAIRAELAPAETPPASEPDTALAEAVADLTKRVKGLEMARWLDATLAETGLSPKAQAILREDLSSRDFADEAAFTAALTEASTRLRELDAANLPPRVQGLGGAPAEGEKPKTAAEIIAAGR